MRKFIVGLVAVAVMALAQPAVAGPNLPTNPCIEKLMDQGYNYKTARRICSDRV